MKAITNGIEEGDFAISFLLLLDLRPEIKTWTKHAIKVNITTRMYPIDL